MQRQVLAIDNRGDWQKIEQFHEDVIHFRIVLLYALLVEIE